MSDFNFDDDFGLDSDLDFGGFDGNTTPPPDDRSPVTRAVGTIGEGAIETLTDPDNIRRTVRDVLPSGYNSAWDAADNVATTGRDLYNSATKELAPLVQETKALTRKLTPRLRQILPESIADKIESWSDENGSGGGGQQEDPNETAITSTLNSIFVNQARAQEETKNEEFVQRTADRMVNTQRYKNQTEQINALITYQDRQVQYQDQILSQFQRKSLEIAMRSYFAQRDLLEHTKLNNENTKLILQGIQKNTGLPDWRKSHLSEDWRALMSEKIMGKTQDSLSAKSGKFWERFGNNLKDEIVNMAATFGSTGAQVVQILGDQIPEGDQTHDEFGNPIRSSTDQALLGAGSNIASRLNNQAAEKLREFLMANPRVMAGNNLLNALFGNSAELMNTIKDREAADFGIEDGIAKTLFDALKFSTRWNGEMGEEVQVLNGYHKDATTAVPWDMAQRKSIIEIIPGLLSRQLQQLEILNTGDTNIDRLVYSAKREGFIGETTAIADAVNDVHNPKEMETYAKEVTDSINKIDVERKLSSGARVALGEMMSELAKKQEVLNPIDLMKEDFFATKTDQATSKELTEYFRRELESTDGRTLDFKKVGVTYRLKKIMDASKKIAEAMPNRQDAINRYVSTGDKELLRKAGIIAQNSSGKDSVVLHNDVARFNQYFLESERASLAEYLGGNADDFQGPPLPPEIEQQRLDRLRRDLQRYDPGASRRSIPPINQPPVPPVPPVPPEGEPPEPPEGEPPVPPEGEPPIPPEGEPPVPPVPPVPPPPPGGNPFGGSGINMMWPSQYPLPQEQMDFLLNPIDTVAANTQSTVDKIQELNANFTRIHNTVADLFAYLVATNGSTDGSGGSGPNRIINPDSIIMNAGRRVLGGIKSLGRGIWNTNRRVFNALVRKPIDIAKNVYNTVAGGIARGLNITSDIYIRGSARAALTAEGIRAGIYRLQEPPHTVIERLSDITGPVVDQDGNVVISLEDFARGFHDAMGRTVIMKAAKWIISAPIKLLRKVFPGPFARTSRARRWVSARFGELRTWVNRTKDIYVRGDDTPALYASKIDAGEYFRKSDLTYVIRTPEDIDGEVVDETGRIVITQEDFEKGFCDVNGQEIKVRSLTGAAFGMIGKGVGKVWKFGKSVAKKVRDMNVAIFNTITNIGGILAGKIAEASMRVQGLNFEQMDVFAKTVNVYLDGSDTVSRTVTSDSSQNPSGDPDDPGAENPNGDGPSDDTPRVSRYNEIRDSLTRTRENLETNLNDIVSRGSEIRDDVSGFVDELRADLTPKVRETIERRTGKSWEELKEILSREELMRLQALSNEEKKSVVKRIFSMMSRKTIDMTWGLLPDEAQLRLRQKKLEIEQGVTETMRQKLEAVTGRSWEDIRNELSLENIEELTRTAEDFDADEFRREYLRGLGRDTMSNLSERLRDRITGGNNDGDNDEEREEKWYDKYFERMREALFGDREVSGDSDGDGYRDGSWQAKIAEAKARREEAKTPEQREKEEKSRRGENGLFSMIMTGIGSRFDSLIDIVKGIAAYLAARKAGDSIDDLMGGGDNDRRGNDDSRRGDRNGRRGILSRAWEGTKNLASRAGGAVAAGAAAAGQAIRTVAGGSIRAGVTRAAMTVGGALLGATAGTVMLAGTVLWGGYKLYKYMSRRTKLEPLEALRFAHYGLNTTQDISDDNYCRQVAAIRILEEEIVGDVQMDSKGIPTWNGDEVALYKELAADFGCSPDEPEDMVNWVEWFRKRFKPVLLTHIANANLIEPKSNIDITDIDDEMKDDNKITFAKQAQYAPNKDYGGPHPYSVSNSPWPMIPINVGYDVPNAMMNAIVGLFGNKEKPAKVSQLPDTLKQNRIDKENQAYDFERQQKSIKANNAAYEAAYIAKQQANGTPVRDDTPISPSSDLSKRDLSGLKVNTDKVALDIFNNQGNGKKVKSPYNGTAESAVRFANDMLPHALRAAGTIGVNPLLLVGQAAQETGWGQHIGQDSGVSSNNLFGIKAYGNWKGPVSHFVTHEYENNRKVVKVEPFRAYDSYEDSFNDFVHFLHDNKRYRGVLANPSDDNAWATGLANAGYATDPAYATRLLGMRNSVLRRLNDSSKSLLTEFNGGKDVSLVGRPADAPLTQSEPESLAEVSVELSAPTVSPTVASPMSAEPTKATEVKQAVLSSAPIPTVQPNKTLTEVETLQVEADALLSQADNAVSEVERSTAMKKHLEKVKRIEHLTTPKLTVEKQKAEDAVEIKMLEQKIRDSNSPTEKKELEDKVTLLKDKKYVADPEVDEIVNVPESRKEPSSEDLARANLLEENAVLMDDPDTRLMILNKAKELRESHVTTAIKTETKSPGDLRAEQDAAVEQADKETMVLSFPKAKHIEKIVSEPAVPVEKVVPQKESERLRETAERQTNEAAKLALLRRASALEKRESGEEASVIDYRQEAVLTASAYAPIPTTSKPEVIEQDTAVSRVAKAKKMEIEKVAVQHQNEQAIVQSQSNVAKRMVEAQERAANTLDEIFNFMKRNVSKGTHKQPNVAPEAKAPQPQQQNPSSHKFNAGFANQQPQQKIVPVSMVK